MKGTLIGESPWYQLFMIFVLAVAGTFVFLAIGIALVPVFFPIEIGDMMTLLQNPGNSGATEILKFLQGFNTIGTFLVPGLLGAYLLSRYPSDYLQINDFPRKGAVIVILIIVLTLSGTIISDALYQFSSGLNFPDFLRWLESYVRESEEMISEQVKAFLVMESFLDFLKIFMVMAVFPAVCEETLFRGVIQPLFIKGFRNVHIGIIVTSVVFGFLHQQFNSFLSIMALSIVLGYLKEWSKSLWVPVIMHLVNNGAIVVAVYFFDMPLDEIDASASQWQEIYFWPGIVVFALCLTGLWYLLRRFAPGVYDPDRD
ncbi:MAG: type II CAAX prenyl endopeptidase Rce1 family protein [Owenweeksia sp.]